MQKKNAPRKAADPDKIHAEYGKDGVFICYDYLTKRGLASITSPLLEYGQKSRPAYQYTEACLGAW